MKITIRYNFVQSLQDQIYIDTGKRVSNECFEFQDADLNPDARANALRSLRHGYYLLVGADSLPDGVRDSSSIHPANSTSNLNCRSVDVATIPSNADALAEVYSQLATAAAYAPMVRDLVSLHAAAHAKEKAEEEAKRKAIIAADVEKNILEVLAWPLARFLDSGKLREKVSAPAHLPDDVQSLAEKDARLAARIAEAEELAASYAKDARAAVVSRGTASQIERHAAGVLPESEYTEIVKIALFEPFGDAQLYIKMTKNDLSHADECEGGCKFSTEDYSGGLTEQQYDSRKAVLEIVDAIGSADALDVAGTITIASTTRQHEAYCSSDVQECTACLTRLSERVTIEFAGVKYTREFAL